MGCAPSSTFGSTFKHLCRALSQWWSASGGSPMVDCALLSTDAPCPVAPCALCGCSECAVSPFLYSSCRFHFAFIFLTGNCDRQQIISTKALETTKPCASGPQSFWSSDLSRLGGRPHSQWYGCWPGAGSKKAHWDGKVRGQVRIHLRQGRLNGSIRTKAG